MNAPAARTGTAGHLRVSALGRQHAWCLRDSLSQLARRPLGTGLTVVVMGLALALPLAFFLLLVNVQHLASVLGDSQSISVFLKTSVVAEEATTLAQDLRERSDVASVHVRTPQQGLAELGKVKGFGDAIHALPGNPLPFVLLVEPRKDTGRAAVEALVRALRPLPDVDLVQDNGQWRARLDALAALGQRITLLVAVLLGAAAVLVIGNTVRLDIRGRADEIAVQQLIGADAAFVRRPYLYEGAWYGLAAGLIAILLVLLVEVVLAPPVRDLVASYGERLRLGGLSWGTLGVAWLIAIALGWLGALVASNRHLERPRA